MDINRNGTLLATSCTDKCVYIWDINTTECVAYLCGHSEVVTDLKFTTDQQHLITVSADGCVFLWKLNNLLNVQPACVANQDTNNGLPWSSARKLSSNYSSSSSSSNIVQIEANTKFNVTTPTQLSLDSMFDSDNEQLPAWARNKLNSGVGVSSSIDNAMASIGFSDSENGKLNDAMGQAQDQPRRGRAVWGPVLDASLSFMVDNENQSIISSPNSFFIEENGNETSSNHSWVFINMI